MPHISDADLAFMRDYIADNYWQNAKRGPSHQYTVRVWRPENDHNFIRFVQLIRTYGHPENFYSKVYIYYAIDGLKYWTMGSPIPETEVINRAPINTFYGIQNSLKPKDDAEETVYDQLASIYDERYQDENSLAENDVVEGVLRGAIKGSVLDIGCGTGLLLELLSIAPKNYLGIDPSQGMMNEFIRKFPNYPFAQTTFEEAELYKFNWAVSLFGSPSYISPSHYPDLIDAADDYFFMFYNKGYLPDYYSENLTKTDYDAIELFFPNTFVFSNYLVATSLGQ